jgi:hypothetical protein
MRVFAISNRGLIVIGILVAVLWGLIYAERVLTVQAQQDYIEMFRAPAGNPAGAESIPAKPAASRSRTQA